MDKLRDFALEDEMDDLIEQAAASIADSVFSANDDDLSDVSEEPQEEELFDSDDLSGAFAPKDTRPFAPGVSYHTYEDPLLGGSVTHGSDGSTFLTVRNASSGGSTTYGPGGICQTVKNAFSDGTTTYAPDGTTYRTEKKLFGGGSVTYGSDGSRFESTPDLFGGGSTTQET